VGRNVAGEAFTFIIENGVVRRLEWPYSSNEYAEGVNNLGQVVGSDRLNAMLWEGDNVIPLSKLGTYENAAYSINDVGQIVGASQIAGNGSRRHACLWEKDAHGQYQIYDLGSFEDTNTTAVDINKFGQIVGYSEDHALTWINGQMIDLGYGYVLGINDAGWIVGGFDNQAVLWKPVPEPTTMLFLITGVIFLRKDKN